MNSHPEQFRTSLASALLCSALALTPAAVLASAAIPSVSPGGVYWQVTVPNDGVSLRVSMPDGSVFEQQFPSGQAPWFTSRKGGALPDGAYAYELVMSPVVSPAVRAQALSSRDSGQVPRLPSGSVESGVFRVVDGVIVLPDDSVVEPRAPAKAGKAPATTANKSVMLKDQVIADDLIVQGSACIGLDCVNNESFGFDTIRLKENNTRIKFEDTSTSAGFPTHDWQLTANDSASGGAEKFSIEDITAATVPFTITGSAPTNSVFVDSTGRVGLRTATPVLDLHINTGNTPATRLEQNSSGGFTAQTWDVAGNEANFFVRDVTGGSRLPFRIRPGAPTSSIDISAAGLVGIGTASPVAKLTVKDTVNGQNLWVESNANNAAVVLNNTNTGGRRFSFQSNSPASAFLITDNTAGNANRLAIDQNGRVGIGTTAPDQLLSVNGDASKVGGGSWLSFSDERLKNLKGSFSSGLDAVMRLQPIRYEYKPDNALGLRSEGEHIGFGAEALRKIIPEAVTRNENGYLMVNNDPILWTMLNAIKEQTREIADLKGQLKRLQAIVRKRTP
jgi:hypothetical protein